MGSEPGGLAAQRECVGAVDRKWALQRAVEQLGGQFQT